MNVRTHSCVFVITSFATSICLGLACLSIPAIVQSLPIESALEGTPIYPAVGALKTIVGIAAYFLGGIACFWLLRRLLLLIFGQLIPSRCNQPQCSGRTRLSQGLKSFVYVCERCGDGFDSGLSFGGDYSCSK